MKKSFPKSFDKFMSDLLKFIGKGVSLETLDQRKANTFRAKKGEIYVKTEHPRSKFRRIRKEEFIKTYCYLLCQKQFFRKELREPLKVSRTSAISTLVAQLEYIGHLTDPIRLWKKK